MSESNLVMVAEKLIDMVLAADKKEVRDTYSLAIRSTIAELGENEAANLIRTIYPKLSSGAANGGDDIKEEVLDIMTEIFKKFSPLL